MRGSTVGCVFGGCDSEGCTLRPLQASGILPPFSAAASSAIRTNWSHSARKPIQYREPPFVRADSGGVRADLFQEGEMPQPAAFHIRSIVVFQRVSGVCDANVTGSRATRTLIQASGSSGVRNRIVYSKRPAAGSTRTNGAFQLALMGCRPARGGRWAPCCRRGPGHPGQSPWRGSAPFD